MLKCIVGFCSICLLIVVSVQAGTSICESKSGFLTSQPPIAPDLKTPLNGEKLFTDTFSLCWYTIPHSSFSQVQVSNQSDFSSLILDKSDLTDTCVTITSLAHDTVHYWKIRGQNVAGWGEFSPTWHFTIMNALLEAPELLTPINGAENIPLSVTLLWRSIALADSYKVQVAGNVEFSNLIINETSVVDTSMNVNGLTNNTIYFWRVRAINTTGSSTYSTVSTFKTIITAPGIPVLLEPSDGKQDVPLTILLKWRSILSADSYYLQVAKTPGFEDPLLTVSSLTDTSYTLNELDRKTHYYWKVRAQNIGGVGQWSTVMSFTTIVPAPSVSELFLPEDGSTGLNPAITFVWRSLPDVETWHLQVSKQSDFVNLSIDMKDIVDTLYQAELETEKIWHWRVSGINKGGEGPCCTAWTFSTGTTGIDNTSRIIPTSFALMPVFPNPFNPVTSITYHVPQTAEISLIVYNSLGQIIRTLVNGSVPPGSYTIKWDSRDNYGQAVTSGLYLCRYEAAGHVFIRKMLLLH